MTFRIRPLIYLTCCSALWLPVRADLELPENRLPELKPILEHALRQSPRVISANLGRLLAEDGVTIADSQLYPNASGSAQYRQQLDDRDGFEGGFENAQKTFFSVSVTQPIYHWGALRNNSRIAQLQLEIAEGRTEQALVGLVSEIRTQYMGLIIAKTSVRNARFVEGIARRRVETLREAFEAGRISAGQVPMAEVNLREAELNRRRAEAGFTNARRSFGYLTGMDPIPLESIPDRMPVPWSDLARAESMLDRFLGGGYAATTSRQNAEMEIEKERLTYAIANRNLWPKLNFQVGMFRDDLSFSSDRAGRFRVTTAFAGIAVNWNIFDGFATRGRKASSLHRRANLERALDETTFNIREGARRALENLQFSVEAMEIAETRMRFAAEGFEHMEQNLQAGVATQEELDVTRRALYEAEQRVFSTRADVYNQMSGFLNAIEEDPARMMVGVRSRW